MVRLILYNLSNYVTFEQAVGAYFDASDGELKNHDNSKNKVTNLIKECVSQYLRGNDYEFDFSDFYCNTIYNDIPSSTKFVMCSVQIRMFVLLRFKNEKHLNKFKLLNSEFYNELMHHTQSKEQRMLHEHKFSSDFVIEMEKART